MIGYLFLSLALFAGLAKGYCGKKSGGLTRDFNDGIKFTIIRMAFCLVLSIVVLIGSGKLLSMWKYVGNPAIFVLSGVSMALFCVTWLFAVRDDSYMFLSVFLMLGSFFTTLCCAVFLNEHIALKQVFGAILLLMAVMSMANYNRSIKGKMTKKGIAILLLCGLFSGVTDFSQKIYAARTNHDAGVYNLCTYAVSIALLMIIELYIDLCFSKSKEKARIPEKRALIYIALMSLFLFINSYMKICAAALLSASQVYLVLQGANLILSSVMAWIFFKERINKNSIIGILLAFLGVVCMI